MQGLGIDKDFIEVNEDSKSYLIVLKEIEQKGKGYIVIKSCTENIFRDIIDEATDVLKSYHTNEIYMTLPSYICTSDEISTDKYTYDIDSKMDSMLFNISEKSGNLATETELSFVPLSFLNAASFLNIYNSCFYDVPNSATYTDEDIMRLLEDNKHIGSLIRYKNEYIGICEMDYSNDIPEIAGISIISDLRKKGLGYKSLAYIVTKLHKDKINYVRLLVSTKNQSAYKLYKKFGFEKESTKSVWYKCR